jgi:hypothetical protein
LEPFIDVEQLVRAARDVTVPSRLCDEGVGHLSLQPSIGVATAVSAAPAGQAPDGGGTPGRGAQWGHR